MTIASRGREALCVCVMCVFERESDGDGGTRNLGKEGVRMVRWRSAR